MRDPSIYDVLVIGAGPAGAAAAWALARAGHRVALTDRESFPRDKTCGDGLIPDSLGALDVMGLRDRVRQEAVASNELRLYAPGGRFVPLAGRFLCIPRLRFDALLVEAAASAGAELIHEVTALAPIEAAGRVAGATFRHRDRERAVEARWTMLATGANATTLEAFRVHAAKKPDAVAGRAYYRVPEAFAARHPHLAIIYEGSICPGYGWIFPGPERRYNVGVAFFSDGRSGMPSLRQLWQRFTTRVPLAAELLACSEAVTGFRGAPIRTGLQRAPLGREGLLVLGDAAAMTYSATGEGIGKAMQSGLLAARMVAEALDGVRLAHTVHEAYDAGFRREFGARYRAYQVAQRWSSHPWLLDLLAWRANAGRFVRRELEALIAEEGDPARLFSARGLVRAVLE